MCWCYTGGNDAVPVRRAPWRGRVAAFVQWALPVATLALAPKCPACFAGYVLLFTGIGLSVPVAAAVRGVLIGVSVAALGYLLVRAAGRARRECAR